MAGLCLVQNGNFPITPWNLDTSPYRSLLAARHYYTRLDPGEKCLPDIYRYRIHICRADCGAK